MTTKKYKVTITTDITIDPAKIGDTGAFNGDSVIVIDPDDPIIPPPPTYAPFNSTLTVDEFSTLTGYSPLQVIDFRDSSTVEFDSNSRITKVNDKTANNHDVFVAGPGILLNKTTYNCINLTPTVNCYNSSLSANFSGNCFAKPFYLQQAILYRSQAVERTLWSVGHASTGGYRVLSITADGLIRYQYKTDSGLTFEKLSEDPNIIGDRFVSIHTFVEKNKLMVYVSDQTEMSYRKILSCEAGINEDITTTSIYFGHTYVAGQATDDLGNSEYLGHSFGAGVVVSKFKLMQGFNLMFGIPSVAIDVGSLDEGKIFSVQFPGRGGASPIGDVADILNPIIFLAEGAPAVVEPPNNYFHNVFSIAADANRLKATGQVNEAWDLTNKADFTLNIPFYPTENTSNRPLLQIGTASFLRIYHIDTDAGAPLVPKIQVNCNGVIATSTSQIILNQINTLTLRASGGLDISISLNNDTPVILTRGAYSSCIGQDIFIAHSSSGFYGRGRIYCIDGWNRALTDNENVQYFNLVAGTPTFRDGIGHEYYNSEINEGPGSTTVVAGTHGPAVGGSTLTNAELKSSLSVAPWPSYVTFVAPKSGKLRSAWCSFKANNVNGYSKGSGWVYKLSVRTSSGGLPTATIVSEGTASGMLENNSPSLIKDFPFTTIGDVVEGQTYHLLFINQTADPSNNYLSINGLFWPTGYHKALEYASPDQSKVFTYYHFPNKNIEPLAISLALNLDTNNDGVSDFSFGHPYVEVYGYQERAARTRPIGGLNRVRSLWRLPYDHTLTQVSLAGYRQSGTDGITVTVKDSSGVVLGSTTIPSSFYQLRSSFVTPQTAPDWGSANFATPIPLVADVIYLIEFSSPTGNFYPIGVKEGTFYGAPSTGIRGGWGGENLYSEMSTNGGSSWSIFGMDPTSYPNTSQGTNAYGPSKRWDISFFMRTTTGTVSSGWAPFVESVTRAQVETNLGYQLLQYINVQDANSVTLNGLQVTSIADKSSFGNNLTFTSGSTLVKSGSRNWVEIVSGYGYNDALGAALAGYSDKAYAIVYCCQAPSNPGSTQTLFGLGRNNTAVYRHIEVNSSGNIISRWQNANGSGSESKTTVATVPLNTPFLVAAIYNRTQLDIYLHDGVTNVYKKVFQGLGGYDRLHDFTRFAVGARYQNDSLSQYSTNFRYIGNVVTVANAYIQNPIRLLEQCSDFYQITSPVPFSSSTWPNPHFPAFSANWMFLHNGTTAGDLNNRWIESVSGSVINPAGNFSSVNGVFPDLASGFARCLSFDGTTNYGVGTVTDALNIGNKANWTVGIPFRPKDVMGQRDLVCLQSGADTGIRIGHNSGKIRYRVNTTNVFEIPDIMSNDDWHYLFIYRSGGSVFGRLYIPNGGTPIISTASGSNIVSDMLNQRFFIGARYLTNTTGQNLYEGDVQSVTFWPTALSTAIMDDLYNGANFQYLPCDALV